jgi:hypothetical protein
MFPTVLAAFKNVETNFSAFLGIELHPAKSLYRAGIDANMALAAGFIQRGARHERSIGQDGNKPHSGTERFG